MHLSFLSDILYEWYSSANLAQFRERALASTQRYFDGEMVCHNELNMLNGASLSVLSRPVDGFDKIRPAFFDHVHQHPSIQHHLAANGTETAAVKTSDFVSQRKWRNSGLYRDFYQPLSDIRYQLTIGQKIDDSLVFFAVSRKNCDFTENERQFLTLLRPHFIQAYRNAKDREELTNLRQAEPECLAATASTQQPKIEWGAVEFMCMQRWGVTKAEARVMRYLVAGLSNVEICDQLHISLSTVKTHLDNIFRRLGVKNRVAAAMAVATAAKKSI
jgi:DNA-binding CsgD family transcriptional regulator